MSNYVAPAIPFQARQPIQAWISQGKPVFHRYIEAPPGKGVYCRNCGGTGELLFSFCLNIHGQYPRHHTIGERKCASVWFEGGGQWPKGFYVVDRTRGYSCEKCAGTGYEGGQQGRPQTNAEKAKRMVQGAFGSR